MPEVESQATCTRKPRREIVNTHIMATHMIMRQLVNTSGCTCSYLEAMTIQCAGYDHGKVPLALFICFDLHKQIYALWSHQCFEVKVHDIFPQLAESFSFRMYELDAVAVCRFQANTLPLLEADRASLSNMFSRSLEFGYCKVLN